MPTGYTAAVQDGSILKFSDFAMICAKAMGACVTLRDESIDAPLPAKFEPQTEHHQKSGAKSQKKLLALENLSTEDIVIQASLHYKNGIKEYAKSNDKAELHRLRYKKMLEEVQAWDPPTDDHWGLREFMIEQLEESIKFDCDSALQYPERLTPTEWHNKELEAAASDVEYHNRAIAEEISRVNTRNAWIGALRTSLKDTGL